MSLTHPNKQNILAILFIWVAAFLAYANSFTISFQFDDTHVVQSNMSIRSLRYVPRYFVDPKTSSYRPENSGYRPMTTLALALGFQLSHTKPWAYHLIKLIEHCLVATLIFLLALRFVPAAQDPKWWIAFFSGLLFAVHRINTEVVDYISAVSSLQAGMFFLLAFYLYLRWKDTGAKWRYAVSCVFYLFSMWSKEEGVTLPAMLFLYETIYNPATDLRARLKRVAPYALLALLFVVLRESLMDPVAHTSRGQVPQFIYFITQIRSWLYYWFLFFWPVELNADNLSFEFSPGLEDWRIWASLAVHAAIWFGAWKARRKKPFVTFVVAWIYITVLPASSVFQLVEAVNEHRAYIPYMFLVMLGTWLLAQGLAAVFKTAKLQRRSLIFVGALLAAALGAGTFARNEVWQTDLTLWEDVYAKNPTSVRAMNVLGISLLNKGYQLRGTELLEKCHKISPTYMPCIVHLSIAYANFKRYDEGLAMLQKGYQLDPNYVHINYHLGIYQKDYFGNLELARQYFLKVEQLTSNRFFQATVKRAEIEMEEGRIDNAIRIAQSVLTMDMTNGDAWDVMGRCYMLKNDFSSATQVFGKLLEMVPNSDRYHLCLANIFERMKNWDLAKSNFEKTIVLNGNSIQAWMGLERIAEKTGSRQAAEQARMRALELRKNRTWTWIPSLFLTGEKPRQTAP